MRPGGRLSAAIEVLADILERHRPTADALKDWGRAHRFAGSADRSHIGNLVYDALRHRASIGQHMGADSPRALALGAMRLIWHKAPETIVELASGEHGPGALSEAETAAISTPPDGEGVADHIAGDYPAWLAPAFAAAFGPRAAAMGKALAERAPVDLRVNTLKATPAKVMKALEKFAPHAGPLSPLAIRIAAPPPEGRSPHVESEPAHAKGWFEIQDAASQIASLLSAARPGQQVADICAGGGGKTLALAALMSNTGQIHAFDNDRHRLRPIFERLKRAGAHNVQVIPADAPEKLDALTGKMDLVLIDAPCSGSGSWRRKPDAKWRLKPEALAQRKADQAAVLERGAALVKPGGRLVYVTCSVLPEENVEQVAAFRARHPQFQVKPYGDVWTQAGLPGTPPVSSDGRSDTLLLTPLDHGTDGFFVAVMERVG